MSSILGSYYRAGHAACIARAASKGPHALARNYVRRKAIRFLFQSTRGL
jgi:hypothetical protein